MLSEASSNMPIRAEFFLNEDFFKNAEKLPQFLSFADDTLQPKQLTPSTIPLTPKPAVSLKSITSSGATP